MSARDALLARLGQPAAAVAAEVDDDDDGNGGAAALLDAVQRLDGGGGGGSEAAGSAVGTAVGRLLAAAYHNCAVQQEAVGEIEAAVASIQLAARLGASVWPLTSAECAAELRCATRFPS
jgi:hypothetical protein